MAERISYAAEKYNLLPENHFGARKKRSAEQTLILLQESIYKSWRNKKIFSLISFDVTRAYNGVIADQLIRCIRTRRIPERWLGWVQAFCSYRSASIVLNGKESETKELPFPDLPQGSPLSPILFLFYNADLIKRHITSSEGAIVFVNNYTAWVIGESVQANLIKIRAIINEAYAWEAQSGATFESDKTTLIYFTRNRIRVDNTPIFIKSVEVRPKDKLKILGLSIDSELR